MQEAAPFVRRHIGPDPQAIETMLKALGTQSLEEFVKTVVPRSIYFEHKLDLPEPLSENAALASLEAIARKNTVARSFIGMGYSSCFTPAVILRNILENPGWYTQYTPYQAEISQGRLEALLNFQTMVSDLTGLPLANASLLDEGTAAAEAMGMLWNQRTDIHASRFFVDEHCHPQTLEVVMTRARPLGIEIVKGGVDSWTPTPAFFGALVAYPNTEGRVFDFTAFIESAHAARVGVAMVTDLLALCLLKSPGEMGADIAVGNSQRFGVPLGFGGPHAAFLSTTQAFSRRIPGRIVGVSKDRQGQNAYRLALQTREQHIRRDKATSNICTAQVLLAIMAGMYAVYHGPQGLRAIAATTHLRARRLAGALRAQGWELAHTAVFDTLKVVSSPKNTAVYSSALQQGMNLRQYADGALGVALDETTTDQDIEKLAALFGATVRRDDGASSIPPSLERQSAYLTHPVFQTHHSETQMLRYIRRLELRDLSLAHSMIALGSCTMKLNATSELLPVSWTQFNALHPFVPADQASGYGQMIGELEKWLAEMTAMDSVSVQPNSGAQGEYAGLLAIRRYHDSRGDSARVVCLIPDSAHGTNPASAVMAGMKVVPVKSNEQGHVDIVDLTAKAQKHRAELAALMVTYPSTYGVFEPGIREICQVVHEAGGQVYMDGANMNAQVGLCRPGDYGVDVCHLNLHKTFCIPHGGGGPGVGPICVARHLSAFLPGDPLEGGQAAVASSRWGSASILPISWMYIRMMGATGLRKASQVAILNANYIAHRLREHYPILFEGPNGRVAHECILDVRAFKKAAGIEVEDIAKRLMDFGFHAPTISWPVAGTLMVEPTESEALDELDRFCEAMIQIRQEIQNIADGKWPREDNPLVNAPHTAAQVTADEWKHPYSRQTAVYPLAWVKSAKFWPFVSRIDNVWGDRNLFCSCPPMES